MKQKMLLSDARNELKGLAILLIAFFHTNISGIPALDRVREIGYGGVDIFILLTGLGYYVSLARDADAPRFFKKRIARLLPAYLPLILCWMAVMYPSYALSPSEMVRGFFGNILMTGFWINTPGLFNWYMSLMLLLILISPAVHGALSRSGRPLLIGFIMLCLSYGLCLANLNADTMMAVTRLPIFITGMMYAGGYLEGLNIWLRRALRCVSLAAGLFLLFYALDRNTDRELIDMGLYWLPMILIAPPFCEIMAGAFAWLKERGGKSVCAALAFLGESSFEIYLVHIWLYEAVGVTKMDGNLPRFLIMLAGIATGIGYHYLIGLGMRAWGRKASVN